MAIGPDSLYLDNGVGVGGIDIVLSSTNTVGFLMMQEIPNKSELKAILNV